MSDLQQGLDKINVNAGYNFTQDALHEWVIKVSDYSRRFNSNSPVVSNPFDLNALFALEKISPIQNTTVMWNEHRAKIREQMTEQSRAILLDPLVRYAVYLTSGGSWAEPQLEFLESQLTKQQLKILLEERRTLDHTIIDSYYETSETKINFLTHMFSFFETVTSLERLRGECKLIVEFGGGYGGTTEILRKLFPDATLIVIDLPEMLVLQSAYLGSYAKCFSDFEGIKPREINLITFQGFLNLPLFLPPDLFVATWSLSEADDETCLRVDKSVISLAKHVIYGFRFREEKNLRMPNSNPRDWMLQNARFYDHCFFSKGAHKYLFY